MLSRLFILSVLVFSLSICKAVPMGGSGASSTPAYSVPQPIIEALSPRGLRASIPDRKGISLMRLAISVNKPITSQRTGSINVEVTYKTGSKWVYEDRTTVLHMGDTVMYLVQVDFNDKTYSRSGSTLIEDHVEIYEGGSIGATSTTVTGHSNERPSPQQLSSPVIQGPSNQATQRPSHQATQMPSHQATQRPSHQATQMPSHQATQRPIHQATQRPSHQATQMPSHQATQRPSHQATQWPSHQATQRPSHQATQRPSHQTTQKPSNQATQGHSAQVIQKPSTQAAQKLNNPAFQRPGSQAAQTQRPSPHANPRPSSQVAEPQSAAPASQHGGPGGPAPAGFASALPQQGSSRPHALPYPTHALSQQERDRPPQEPPPEINNIHNPWTISYEQATQRQPTKPTALEDQCVRSLTSVNGKLVCRGELVFLENFDDLGVDKWIHDVLIPGNPDHEFNILTNDVQNTYTINGQLVIRPTLTEDVYGPELVRSGRLELANCTAGPSEQEQCSRQAKFGYILPPVMTGRISTQKSFSYRYGRLEIRAKLPSGDWLYPELWLRPREDAYGPALQSGRIQVAMARGNQDLHSFTADRTKDIELGARRLEAAAIAVAPREPSLPIYQEPIKSHKEVSRTELPGSPWSGRFHNYTLEWTPESLVFSVDGVELGTLFPEQSGGFLVTNSNPGGDPWQHGGRMAPFDREFYISLGLGVGGIRNFPDGIGGSDGSKKPWKNTAAKAMLSFWNAKDQWYNSWNSNSALLVDFVRVTAL